MDDEKTKLACKPQRLEPEQLKSIRCWLDELEGSNRKIAFELLTQVVEGKITNEEAFALLECKRDKIC